MNPTDDMPSADSETCDVGGCCEPYAWSPEGSTNGPRELRLCECHADEWLRSERELAAEREELAGRELSPSSFGPLFGIVRALEEWRIAPRKRSA